jgi:hypothetical protein
MLIKILLPDIRIDTDGFCYSVHIRLEILSLSPRLTLESCFKYGSVNALNTLLIGISHPHIPNYHLLERFDQPFLVLSHSIYFSADIKLLNTLR